MRHLAKITTICASILVIFCTSEAQVHISGNLEGVLEDTTYVVDGDIYVQETDSLIIAPGSEFYFSGNYEFEINGYLYCVGTEEDSIIFAPADSVQYWAGICFNQTAANSCCLGYTWVTGGHAAGSMPDNCGGGVLCYGCSPAIFNCKISDNSASYSGGGIALVENFTGGLVIRDCQIWENNAENTGGGIYIYMSSSPLLENLDLRGNIAADFGGGICNVESSPLIVNCTINKNQSDLGGGGFYCYATWGTIIRDCQIKENVSDGIGGGIFFDFKVYNLLIEGCTISGNEAEEGGGIAFGCDGNGSMVDHCVIEDNYAELLGGGMICKGASGTTLNCTFHNNEAGTFGGAFYSCYELHDFSFVNNIVDGNSDGIYFERSEQDTIAYCDFHDNPGGNFLGIIPANIGILSATNFNGDSCDTYFNIFLDPLFVGSDDLHLQEGSPCIDAGDPVFPLDPDSTIADIGRYYFDQTPTSPVTIEMTPLTLPTIIPPTGGRFDYNVELTNNESTPITFDAWIRVQLPNGSWYGPVLGPVNITLPANQSMDRDRVQGVPGGAPAGIYTYEGRVGIYPDSIWDQDSFEFQKLSTGDGEIISEWMNSGEEFITTLPLPNGAETVPESFSFHGLYPNPFNPETKFSFALPEASQVSLKIYNLHGKLVATLVDGMRTAGTHDVTFDASNLASGIYLYRLTAGNNNINGKMMLIK